MIWSKASFGGQGLEEDKLWRRRTSRRRTRRRRTG
jgi:hypothetical protein